MKLELKDDSSELIVRVYKEWGAYELTVYTQEGFYEPVSVGFTLSKEELEGLIKDLQGLLE
jgi:hypothetical protein